jgi:hypothetical protein
MPCAAPAALSPTPRRCPTAFYDDLAALAAIADEDPSPFAVADDFARKALTTEENTG